MLTGSGRDVRFLLLRAHPPLLERGAYASPGEKEKSMKICQTWLSQAGEAAHFKSCRLTFYAGM